MHRPDRSPSQRFRFEQYLDYIKQNGYDYEFSYLISADDDKILYKPGNLVGKMSIFLRATLRRLGEALRASSYDIIFIQREAYMLGTAFFEKAFARSNAKLIFDYDDSIWVNQVSAGNKKFSFLKNADKTRDIIRVSDMVFAGNQYLADFAAQYNSTVRIVPTTIDTDEYQRLPRPADQPADQVCIGWSGSFTTLEHFETALPALRIIQKEYGNRVTFRVVGDGAYRNAELGITGLPWRKDTEVADLSAMDIGIMPLPDTEWAKGKCGLKGLQYMAVETPTIMSPVGVNTEIIQHGKNGLLASTTDEWVAALRQLIDNAAARKQMGRAGRETVVSQFSVLSERSHYLQLFEEVLAQPAR
jgi:glycosyltransferase involved in cell wall biosynthesis